MKTNRTSRKLALGRDTLRRLSSANLRGVAAAYLDDSKECAPREDSLYYSCDCDKVEDPVFRTKPTYLPGCEGL
jgi:hypothetical protein